MPKQARKHELLASTPSALLQAAKLEAFELSPCSRSSHSMQATLKKEALLSPLRLLPREQQSAAGASSASSSSTFPGSGGAASMRAPRSERACSWQLHFLDGAGLGP